MSAFTSDLQTLLPDLNRFARVLTRNEDDAYDLVQDCVERALRKQELFQTGTSLKSWLFTLMRNIFISQKRRVALDKRYVTGLKEESHTTQRAGQVSAERELAGIVEFFGRPLQLLDTRDAIPPGQIQHRRREIDFTAFLMTGAPDEPYLRPPAFTGMPE